MQTVVRWQRQASQRRSGNSGSQLLRCLNYCNLYEPRSDVIEKLPVLMITFPSESLTGWIAEVALRTASKNPELKIFNKFDSFVQKNTLPEGKEDNTFNSEEF